MNNIKGLFHRLGKAEDGAAAVEFGLLATIVITMLLGVLQVGIGMQNYNAVRNVSAEVARYAMVQYETGNKLSNSQIRTYALSTARSAPYLLDHTRVEASVLDAFPQRVAGARELNLQIRYQVPIIIGFLGIPDPQIGYRRPIFLLDNSAEVAPKLEVLATDVEHEAVPCERFHEREALSPLPRATVSSVHC